LDRKIRPYTGRLYIPVRSNPGDYIDESNSRQDVEDLFFERHNLMYFDTGNPKVLEHYIEKGH
jgi:hypothetical protein